MWVLTAYYYDYDQFGEYFIAWFPTKPTKAELNAVICEEVSKSANPDVVLDHVLTGGGRRDSEYVWWYLRKVEPCVRAFYAKPVTKLP